MLDSEPSFLVLHMTTTLPPFPFLKLHVHILIILTLKFNEFFDNKSNTRLQEIYSVCDLKLYIIVDQLGLEYRMSKYGKAG